MIFDLYLRAAKRPRIKKGPPFNVLALPLPAEERNTFLAWHDKTPHTWDTAFDAVRRTRPRVFFGKDRPGALIYTQADLDAAVARERESIEAHYGIRY